MAIDADLKQSINDAVIVVRHTQISFFLACAYLALTLGSTHDAQLVTARPLILPIVQVGLPIIGFFAVIPWLLILLHFNILLQHYLLARRLHDADVGKRDVERLFQLPFVYALIDGERGTPRLVLKAVMWTTLAILPLSILVWTQIRLLPLHDSATTWSHRLAVLTAVVQLWVFWPMTAASSGHAVDWWRWVARRRDSRGSVSAVYSATGALMLVLVAVAGIGVSFFTALIPGEPLERKLLAWAPTILTTIDKGCTGYGGRCLITTFAMFDSEHSPFHRNLRLSYETLIANESQRVSVSELRSADAEARRGALKDIIGVRLAGYDLRHADMRGAILAKADLRGAQLDGANLSRAVLSEADLGSLNEGEIAGCRETIGGSCATSASGANFREATMERLRASSSVFVMSQLGRANLTDADLSFSVLTFAELRGSKLLGADLTHATLIGADLEYAEAHAANAKGADFSGGELGHTEWSGANLEGASLYVTHPSYAEMRYARLWGAKVHGSIYLTLARLDYADARVDLSRLDRYGYDEVSRALDAAVSDLRALKVSDIAARARAIRVSLRNGRRVKKKMFLAAEGILCDEDLVNQKICLGATDEREYNKDMLDQVDCGDQRLATRVIDRFVTPPDLKGADFIPSTPPANAWGPCLEAADAVVKAAFTEEWGNSPPDDQDLEVDPSEE